MVPSGLRMPSLLVAGHEERGVDRPAGTFDRRAGQLVLVAAAQVAVHAQQPLVQAEAGLAEMDEVGVVHDQAQTVGHPEVADVKALQPEIAELAVLTPDVALDGLVPVRFAVLAAGQDPRPNNRPRRLTRILFSQPGWK